uniref:Myocardin n=1 Tax=Sphaeramia orbicularis TaxID=375764 RepID=A0A673AEI4_9TELE
MRAQMRLKRARLAEDLNEKLALRPGPLELVQKNIIPLDSAVTMTGIINHGKFPKQEDSYAFEEDSSSDSLSPEQHHSDESQGSACPSSEAVGSTPSSSSSPALTSPRQTSDKNRHKKPKDVKPKVKKLKYHQYIPPDQKAEKSPPPMDSAYARLLQQQQLFLQLQILSQQKHPAFSYQPHPSTQMCEISSGPSSTVNSNSSSPVKNTYPNQSNISSVKPGPLPANLDDLKVSELRQHLRIRGMPVSGTKTALIERLRPFKDSNAGSSPSGSSDITTVTFPVTPTGSLSSYQSPSSSSALSQGGYYPYPSTSSSPPISPVSSDLSLSGSLPDSFSDVPMSSPTQFNLQPSPAQLSMEDGLGGGGQRSGEGGGMDGLEAEKDKMLVEKQKVIEELTWKLHQEQRQVEELKMQLHKRKRCYGATQDTIPPPSQSHHPSICMEDLGHCNTQLSNMGAPGGTQCMDAAPSSGSPSTMSAFLSPQCSPQDSPIGKPSSSPQPSSPNNPYLLSPGLGRDGCGHAHQQGNARARTIGLMHAELTGLESCSVNPPYAARTLNLCDPPPLLFLFKEMPANAREDKERSCVTKVVPHITVSPGCPGLLVPRFHRHYEHPSPTQLPYDHSANHIADGHLETLLSSPVGRGGEVAFLKWPPRTATRKTKGTETAKGAGRMVSMTFSETPWETMEWLDLTPPSSAMAFSVGSHW